MLIFTYQEFNRVPKMCVALFKLTTINGVLILIGTLLIASNKTCAHKPIAL